MSTSFNTYEYSGKPYFSIDIDADLTGFCMIELIQNEYAKLAKDYLEERNYDGAMECCQIVNAIQKSIDKARECLKGKETADAETS